MDIPTCEHLKDFKIIPASKDYCEECIKIGSSWVHLRCCQTCGAVLCCDSSPNRHASKHAFSLHHPVIISAEADENWAYCYLDDQAVEI
jgi:uncharacterized UBP type Zn finger protein